MTALRLENFSRSVSYRLQRLKEELKPFGEIHELDHRSSLAFWDELRQLSILQDLGCEVGQGFLLSRPVDAEAAAALAMRGAATR